MAFVTRIWNFRHSLLQESDNQGGISTKTSGAYNPVYQYRQIDEDEILNSIVILKKKSKSIISKTILSNKKNIDTIKPIKIYNEVKKTIDSPIILSKFVNKFIINKLNSYKKSIFNMEKSLEINIKNQFSNDFPLSLGNKFKKSNISQLKILKSINHVDSMPILDKSNVDEHELLKYIDYIDMIENSE